MRNNKKTGVIGLGQMGRRLAQLLLQEQYEVKVWNRTPERAATLLEQGAILGKSVADTLAFGEITILCVSDYAAAQALLHTPEAIAALSGKLLIQLTTGSPQEAEALAQLVHASNGLYLDGGIQVAPDQMAQPDTTIFISGAANAWAIGEPVLRIFGGNIHYLGESPSSAAVMDFATLSYLYGTLAGFFQSVLLAEAAGIKADKLGVILSQITPNFTAFIQHQANTIASGDFTITQSPLQISVDATRRILETTESFGLNTELPRLTANLLQRAADAGLEKEELASLIKVLRQPVKNS